MIEVNLLGEKDKKEWALYNLSRIAAYLGALTVFVILIFSGALIICNKKISGSLNIAKNRINNFQEGESLQEKEMKKEIDKVNAKIYFFGGLLQNYKEISYAAEELSNIFPAEIDISSISLQLNGGKHAATIKGSSLNRADFLKLQSLMEKNSCFSNIQSPLSNITKKKDIDFVITADINIKN